MLQGAYYPWVGGAEIFMQNVAEKLAKKDDIDVVTGLWAKPDIMTESWNDNFETINKVKVYRVKTLNIPYLKTISAILPMYGKAKKMMTEKKYDLIHAHIFPAMIPAALLKKKFPLVPMIITVQGGDLADYKENTGKFGFLLRLLISYAIKKADLVHAVSQSTAERAKQLGAKKIVIIPNGVDRRRFFPLAEKTALREKFNYAADEKIILTVSRLTPKNGIIPLIEACNELAITNKIRLIIIGGGEQESKIRSLIQTLGCVDIVDLKGYIDNSGLNEFYNLSDVFCRPSLEEGFGISFIEAMAAGLTVVGTSTGGIPDIIENGETGFLVKAGNRQELINSLNIAINEKDYAEKLRSEAKNKVKSVYCWDKVIGRINNLYDEFWKKAGAPRD